MKIKIWMVFEAVAADIDSVDGALEEHIELLESEKHIEILESEIEETSEVENPHPGLEKGYSKIAEVRIEVAGFDKAVNTVLNYGPTYVQMEGPDNYNMKLREGQEALQKVASTMHQYAQMGPGGVLISRSAEEE